MASTLLNATSSAQTRSALSLDSDLKNPLMVTKGGRLEQARIMWDFFFNKPADTRPAGKIPLQALTTAQLLTAPNHTVYRLGHSTVLMKLQDGFLAHRPDLFRPGIPGTVCRAGAVSRAAHQHRRAPADQGGHHLPRPLRPPGP